MLSQGAFAALADLTEVIPGGQTTGIRIESNGVIIVGLTQVSTAAGVARPAQDAGLLQGDILYELNGQNDLTNDKVLDIIESSGGEALRATIERDGKTIHASFTPAKSQDDDKYKLGVMIRDSIAGIGTITFIDPDSGVFGSLGHAVCDSESGVLVPIKDGSIVPSKVVAVDPGEVGRPGSLQGEFEMETSNGDLKENTVNGLFGIMTESDAFDRNLVTIASPGEVKEGSATILSNVHLDEIKEYSIEIEKVFGGSEKGNRNMLIRITDPSLLEITGGIVQGMSGSPILQNGKLVGAVTHVLVGDPQKGYGIFIENMLEEANDLDEKAA